jgi:hypothetical protein
MVRMKEFKFFQKNRFKDKCRLQIGSSFQYRGYYCTVTQMLPNDFRFTVQETGFSYLMSYNDYLKTPSAAGRQLNRW